MATGYALGAETGPGDFIVGTAIGLALFTGVEFYKSMDNSPHAHSVSLRTPNSANYGPYPRPGMDYQTYKLATENSYKTDPDPNDNWKGTIATIAESTIVLNWLQSNASGIEGQGPTNIDLLLALNKWAVDT